LLDDCVAIVPVFHESFLHWHYRSRDERLIKFSNHFFYENRLITFPGCTSSGDGRGVRLVYQSDGIWDRGRSRTNRTEARTVAQLALEHFTTFPERSLGIVAMNTSQREAIEDAISEELQERPNMYSFFDTGRHERFFVKSLENVQGDERDTMIISVGYGKDSNGGLSYNFGPINTDGGWRRLNVLVTSAKWQTILVTSLRSQDLAGINPHNRGAISLRNFIEFAERLGELPSDVPVLVEAETNDFEDAVREMLVERGFSVDQQVGASRYRIDLAIRDRRDPFRYLLGIECDGATYHGSRTARDRDLLRQQVLHEMGWRLHRVWSTEWFHDRAHAIESLLKSIENAETLPAERVVHTSSSEAQRNPEPDPPRTSTGERPRSDQRRYQVGTPYKRYQCSATRSKDYILQHTHNGILAASIAEIVRIEGPIHEDLLTERLKEMHGIERAGSNVQANIRHAIQSARSKGVERGSDQKFIRQAGVTLQSFRVPADGVRRPLESIPAEEIACAILYLIEDQFGMMRDQIPQAVSRLFGVERLRGDSADIIRNMTDRLIEQGRLRTSGPQVYVA
jgi:very-short-patch-repair endonuclease